MSSAKSIKLGLIAGLAAAAAVLALDVLIQLTLSIPTFTELVWDFAVGKVPGPLFSQALDTLKYAGKPLFLVGLTALQLFVGGVLGVIYAIAVGSRPSLFNHFRSRPWLSGILYGLLLWAIAIIIGIRFVSIANWWAWFGAMLAFVAFGALQSGLLNRLAETESTQERPNTVDTVRRDLLFKGIAALVALSIGGVLFKAVLDLVEGGVSQVKAVSSKITSYITPNDDFYKVSKNLNDPVVDAKSWHLEIKGLVANPLKLTLDDIKSMPSVTQVTTLECISNEIGGDLIGNAVWKGVHLADLLTAAGIASNAVKVALRAADHYSDSISLERAMAPGTVLAYEMNGQTLPAKHGFPLRLLVPGIYGMKNVKWITEIEPVDYDFKGYWQNQGWSDTAMVHTNARIDTPDKWDVVTDTVNITGIAFAGDRGISQVEISLDDGRSWQQAVLGKTESPYSWVLWTLDWRFETEGPQTIIVRAADGQGVLQESKESMTYPNGATGYDKITVTVKRSAGS